MVSFCQNELAANFEKIGTFFDNLASFSMLYVVHIWWFINIVRADMFVNVFWKVFFFFFFLFDLKKCFDVHEVKVKHVFCF